MKYNFDKNITRVLLTAAAIGLVAVATGYLTTKASDKNADYKKFILPSFIGGVAFYLAYEYSGIHYALSKIYLEKQIT